MNMKYRGLALLLAVMLVTLNMYVVVAAAEVNTENMETEGGIVEQVDENSTLSDNVETIEETEGGIVEQLDANNTLSDNVETIEDTEGIVEDKQENVDTNVIEENKDDIVNESETILDEEQITEEQPNEDNNVEEITDKNEIVETEPNAETIEQQETEQIEQKEPENYVGLNESELSEETRNNVTINYVINDDVEEGTILSQKEEDGTIILEIATPSVEVAEPLLGFRLLNSFDLMAETTEAPTIEEDTWDGYPLSYEYNWDNSDNCWKWGVWDSNGNCYKTPEGTYDNNVRHAIGVYSDGENIHLYVSYATIYTGIACGDDYNFTVDGQNAKFRILYADNGSSITSQYRPEGTYDLVVVNGDDWNSNYDANGSYGTIVIKENNKNNEMEIVVPLETLKQQNSNIDIEHIQNIEFYNPNITYRHIGVGGASTGSNGFVLITLLSCVMACFIYKYNKGNMQRWNLAFNMH